MKVRVQGNGRKNVHSFRPCECPTFVSGEETQCDRHHISCSRNNKHQLYCRLFNSRPTNLYLYGFPPEEKVLQTHIIRSNTCSRSSSCIGAMYPRSVASSNAENSQGYHWRIRSFSRNHRSRKYYCTRRTQTIRSPESLHFC